MNWQTFRTVFFLSSPFLCLFSIPSPSCEHISTDVVPTHKHQQPSERITDGEMNTLSFAERGDVEIAALIGLVGHMNTDTPV